MIENTLQAASRWLSEYLRGKGGQSYADELFTAAEAAGYSKIAIYRARGRCPIVINKQGFGPGGKWFWTLREDGR